MSMKKSTQLVCMGFENTARDNIKAFRGFTPNASDTGRAYAVSSKVKQRRSNGSTISHPGQLNAL